MTSAVTSSFVPWQELEPRFSLARRVAWSETDQHGSVHFAHYVRFAEETEYAFLRSRNVPRIRSEPRGVIGFPRLQASCEIRRPLRREEEFVVELVWAAHDGKQIAYRFQLRVGTELVAEVQFRVACCRFPGSSPPYAIPLPSAFLDPIFGNA